MQRTWMYISVEEQGSSINPGQIQHSVIRFNFNYTTFFQTDLVTLNKVPHLYSVHEVYCTYSVKFDSLFLHYDRVM